MRKRGIRIHPEFVVIGVVVYIAIAALTFAMNGCLYHEHDPYGERDGTSVYGSSADQIGPQWSPEKDTLIHQLNQKMYHDLELTPIE